MKHFSKILLVPFALFAVVGCNNAAKKTDKEIVEEILANPALLMNDVNSSGLSSLIPSGTKFSIKDNFSYAGISHDEMYPDATFEWSFDDATKWTVGAYSDSEDYTLLTPVSNLYVKGDNNPSYDSVLTLTVKYKNEEGTATWRAHYSANYINQISLPTLRTKIRKKEVVNTSVFETFGYVTGWFNNTPRVGTFIQDGEGAICLYDNNNTGLLVKAVEDGLQVGDLVRALGKYDVTGGLTRFIISEFEKVEEAPFEVATPAPIEVTADNFSNAGLTGHDSQKATATGLIYQSALNLTKKEVEDITTIKPGGSFFLRFTAKDSNGQDVDIDFNCNSYLGKTIQQSFIDMAKDWQKGETIVAFNGIVYYATNQPYLVGFDTSCFSLLG